MMRDTSTRAPAVPRGPARRSNVRHSEVLAVASTRYDNPNGVAGLAIMVGLVTWMVVGGLLAYWRGFDPEGRYAGLVPRRSIDSFAETGEFLRAQLKRQKDRMMGR